MGDVDTARDMLWFLEKHEGIDSTIKSDHVLNLFAEVDGKLPDEKQKMMQPIQEFLQLTPEEQMLFSIGRRSNHFMYYSDLNEPYKRHQVNEICNRLGANIENYDDVINSIMQRYI